MFCCFFRRRVLCKVFMQYNRDCSITASSKCCIDTNASEECFAASSGVEYFARYSCSTTETAVLATVETSAPLNPSVTSAIVIKSTFLVDFENINIEALGNMKLRSWHAEKSKPYSLSANQL